MKINLRILFALALWVGLLPGCHEEIDLESRQFKSQIYVDGGISNEPGPYTIKLFVTAPLNDPGREPLKNCRVSIEQESGQSETLTEAEPGVYKTSPGRIR